MLQMLAQTAVVLFWRCLNLVVKCEHPLPMSVRFAQLSLLSEACKCVLVGLTNSATPRVSPDWKLSHIVRVAGEKTCFK